MDNFELINFFPIKLFERILILARTNLYSITFTILYLFGIFFAIKLINYIYNKYLQKIKHIKEKVFKSFKIGNYEILNSRVQALSILYLLRGFRFIGISIILIISFPVLFSLFPETREYVLKVLNLVLQPLKKILLSIINYLPNLITIFIIIVIVNFVLKMLRFLTIEIEKRNLKINGFYPEWAKPTYNLLKILVFIFMFIIIFPYLPGSDSPIFKGVSVFLGVLISFGSGSSVGNIVSGIVLTYMRSYKIGDYVRINNIEGIILEKNLLETRIKTLKNEVFTIPNSIALSKESINYSHSAKRNGILIYTSVTIGYDVKWQKVNEMLIEAALKTEGVVKKSLPFVLQTSLDDYYVSYQINALIREAKKIPRIKSELHKNILDVFNRENVEIMSPHYRVNRLNNDIAIPEEYVEEDNDNMKDGDFDGNRKD